MLASSMTIRLATFCLYHSGSRSYFLKLNPLSSRANPESAARRVVGVGMNVDDPPAPRVEKKLDAMKAGRVSNVGRVNLANVVAPEERVRLSVNRLARFETGSRGESRAIAWTIEAVRFAARRSVVPGTDLPAVGVEENAPDGSASAGRTPSPDEREREPGLVAGRTRARRTELHATNPSSHDP
jgi:hypothetical protein